jgi:hypothetical protein
LHPAFSVRPGMSCVHTSHAFNTARMSVVIDGQSYRLPITVNSFGQR